MKKNASSKSLQMMQAQADPESSVPLLGDGDDSNDKWIRPASSLNNATLATSTACGASSATSTAACNLKRTLLRQVLFFLVITGFFAQTFLWLRWESEQDQYAKMAEAELNEEYFGSDSETNVTVPVDFGKLLHQLRVHVDWINKAPNKLNGWVEPVACEIPLQVHPFDPSIAKYLIPAKPIVCPVKKEYAVQNDVTGEIKAQTKLIHSDGVICMWNTIQPFFMSNQTLKYKNKNWQRFDDQTVNMNRLNLTNVHILCKHNWVFETYSQFFEWPVLPDDGRATRAVIKTDDSAVAAGRNSAKPLPAKPKVPLVPAENGMDGLSGNDSIPESCPVNPNVLLLMVESLSRLNYLRYMNRTRDVLASWPGIVRPLDGVFKLGDNSYPNIYPLLTGRTVDDLKLRPDSTHSELAYQSLLWKQFERMRGFYHSHHEDMPYWGTFHSHGALGMLRSPADVHPREYWCALDNLHTKGAIEGSCRFTSYLCHRGEAQFGLSLRSGERFMRHVLAEGKKFFAFVDPCKFFASKGKTSNCRFAKQEIGLINTRLPFQTCSQIDTRRPESSGPGRSVGVRLSETQRRLS